METLVVTLTEPEIHDLFSSSYNGLPPGIESVLSKIREASRLRQQQFLSSQRQKNTSGLIKRARRWLSAR